VNEEPKISLSLLFDFQVLSLPLSRTYSTSTLATAGGGGQGGHDSGARQAPREQAAAEEAANARPRSERARSGDGERAALAAATREGGEEGSFSGWDSGNPRSDSGFFEQRIGEKQNIVGGKTLEIFLNKVIFIIIV